MEDNKYTCSIVPEYEANIDTKDSKELQKKIHDLLDQLEISLQDVPKLEPSVKDLTDTTLNGVGAIDKLVEAVKNNLVNLKGFNVNDVSNIIAQIIPTLAQLGTQFVTSQYEVRLSEMQARAQVEQIKIATIGAKLQALMIPAQLEALQVQIASQKVQMGLIEAQRVGQHRQNELLCLQQHLLQEQIEGQKLQNKALEEQVRLAKYNADAARAGVIAAMAQYQDEVVYEGETNPIRGTIGLTKDMQLIQIDGFDRSTGMNLLQLLLNAFSTLKAADKGLLTPSILAPETVTSLSAQLIDDLFGYSWLNYGASGVHKSYLSERDAENKNGYVSPPPVKYMNTRKRRIGYFTDRTAEVEEAVKHSARLTVENIELKKRRDAELQAASSDEERDRLQDRYDKEDAEKLLQVYKNVAGG